LNKKSCGTINIKNDINLLINDSNFISNKGASEGGAMYVIYIYIYILFNKNFYIILILLLLLLLFLNYIIYQRKNRCLIDYSNIKFNLNDSSFEKNNGKYGGALYFDSNHSHNTDNHSNEIIFENVTFKENYVNYFGGAIYSKNNELNSLKSTNVIFNENQAGVAGGGVFIFNTNSNFQNIPYESFDFNNNKANSHGDDIGTSPSLIKFKNDNSTISVDDHQEYTISSGSYFPLKFSLYDNFNNLIKDPNNYYSNIIINISLQNNTKNYKSKGNVGSFSKGN